MGFWEDRILTSRTMPIGPKIISDTGTQLNSHNLEDSVISNTTVLMEQGEFINSYKNANNNWQFNKTLIVLEKESGTISPIWDHGLFDATKVINSST